MRNRLVELLKNAHDEQKYLTSDKSIQAIADYLLANGVVVPPCKVGDAVYCLSTSSVRYGEMQISKYIVTELLYSTKRGVRPWVVCCFGGRRFDNLDFDKTVFLDREDAERALKGEKG